MSLNNLAIDASRMVTGARTGTENYSVNIIRELALRPERPAITLYGRSGHPLEDVPGTTVKVSGPSRLWTHVGLSRALRRDQPDALFVPSHVIPLVHPRTSVVTVHDVGYLHEPDAHPRRQRLMLDRTTRWNVRSARRVIAISGQTRDDLIEHYRAEPGRVSVIHHGVDHQRFRPGPVDGDAERLSAMGVDRPYLLFVSTVQPRKNVVRLVEAFESLNVADLSLVVAGKSGWMSDPIEDRIRSSSAVQKILRVGRVPDADLPALYRGAVAFVLPSLFEGFGMGVLEAMACGTPVVTSNSGALAEVAGDAAILVDPVSIGDIAGGIERALEGDISGERRRLGLHRASGFTWRKTAEQTIRVIQDAFDET